VSASPIGTRLIFREFWPATRGYRGRLGASALLAVAGPVVDTVQIWMFKLLIDDVIVPRNLAVFPLLAVGYLAVGLAQGVGSYADQWLGNWLSERFVLDLRTRVFDHLQGLSVDYFDRRQLGDIVSRLTSDIDAIERVVVSGVTEAGSYLVQIGLFAAALIYLNWQLALVSLVAAPVFLLAGRHFSARIKDAAREQRRSTGSLTAVAEESLGNLALVQAYVRQASETERFRGENLRRFTAQLRATRLRGVFGAMMELLETAGVVLVVGLGVWELGGGRISLGGLLVFVTYLSQLYSPIRGAGRLSNTGYAAIASAERILELLAQRPTVTDPVHPRPLGRATGALVFDSIQFRYPGRVRPALSGVTFVVSPGQRVALVGPSGAGKSTIAKLLLRFYDPNQGRISLDGIDLRNVSLDSLRRNIATVLQETLVFDGTIRENILWGRPDATERQLLEASVAADAHEFITALPDGYDTRIGQRGRLLSGGQRQRLAIARAMLRDAPVLLLDEPTTGLDAAAAQRVLVPMRRLMSGRTTLIISHDLLTVTDVDLILYLEGGRVAGAGTHPQLLAASRGYAHLYRLHQQPAVLTSEAAWAR
jgi:ABC-type multidrug transport system fused ATPase/permease subunit